MKYIKVLFICIITDGHTETQSCNGREKEERCSSGGGGDPTSKVGFHLVERNPRWEKESYMETIISHSKKKIKYLGDIHPGW